jgi:integrase
VSPERTDGTRGSFRFDEQIPGVGRLRLKSGARTLREHHRRVALIRKLRDQGRLDLLRAFHVREITILELLDADRRDQLPHLVADVFTSRPLWPEVDRVLDGIRKAPATVETYRKSWKALKEFPVAKDRRLLPAEARVKDLLAVDWHALEARWGRSAASWNHLRRAVSRFLSTLLGSRWHPFRSEVLRGFPTRVEIERTPELSVADFQRVLKHLEEPVRPAIMLLAMTGMRLGEYLRLRPEHLGQHVIRVPGTKTRSAARTLPVDPKLWPWVVAGVPCPVTHWMIWSRWAAALEAAEVEYVRIHDLRHCTAQWLHDAGRPLASLMQTLGHTSIAQTQRYASRRLRQDDAAAMAVLLAPQVDPQVRVSRETRKRARR